MAVARTDILPLQDFKIFHASASAFVHGHDIYGPETTVYGFTNLNPPVFTLLIAPLGWLSLRAAFAVWTGAGVICLVASLHRISRSTALRPSAIIWIAGLALGTLPSQFVWLGGQVTWFLMYLVTRAWAAESRRAAAPWLGLAILLKPPLALALLALPWALGLEAFVWVAGGAAATALVVGLGPWREWLALSSAVWWLPSPLNASLFGLAARLHGGMGHVTTADIPAQATAVIALVGAVAVWLARQVSLPSRWALGVLLSLLFSPLGWIYYLPLALGPALTLRPIGPLALAALALMAIPRPIVLALLVSHLPQAIVGSISCAAAVLMWSEWARSGRRHKKVDLEDGRDVKAIRVKTTND